MAILLPVSGRHSKLSARKRLAKQVAQKDAQRTQKRPDVVANQRNIGPPMNLSNGSDGAQHLPLPANEILSKVVYGKKAHPLLITVKQLVLVVPLRR